MLSSELAQRVVDQVRPSVDHNINIMDHRGVIIASADPDRLGTTHDGAIAALERGDVVRIERGSAGSGTKAGVNVPLVIDGTAVGVVGVTGDPATVEPVARILELTVMLLIRQERQLADSHWRESRVRDLITLLLDEPGVSDGRIGAALRDIGSPSEPPWSVLVAVDTAAGRADRLRASISGLDNVVSVERFGALWFLLGRANGGIRATVLDGLRSRGATVIAGRSTATTAQLALDVRRLDILTRRTTPRDGLVHDLDRFDFDVLIGQQAVDLSIDRAARYVLPLTETLRHTASVFLSHRLSVVASAEALHTHRNTVVQRLDRIRVLTALDLRDFDDAVTMRIALAALIP